MYRKHLVRLPDVPGDPDKTQKKKVLSQNLDPGEHIRRSLKLSTTGEFASEVMTGGRVLRYLAASIWELPNYDLLRVRSAFPGHLRSGRYLNVGAGNCHVDYEPGFELLDVKRKLFGFYDREKVLLEGLFALVVGVLGGGRCGRAAGGGRGDLQHLERVWSGLLGRYSWRWRVGPAEDGSGVEGDQQHQRSAHVLGPADAKTLWAEILLPAGNPAVAETFGESHAGAGDDHASTKQPQTRKLTRSSNFVSHAALQKFLQDRCAGEKIVPGYGRAEQILVCPQKKKNHIFLSFPFSHAPAFSFFSCVFLFSSGSVDIVGLVCRSACRFALPGWGPAVAMDVECGLAVAMRRTTCWPRTNSGGRLMVVGGKSLWFFSGVVIFVLSSIGGCQVTR